MATTNKKAREAGVDPICLVLAAHFLGAERTDETELLLAQAVQRCVEDWFEEREEVKGDHE